MDSGDEVELDRPVELPDQQGRSHDPVPTSAAPSLESEHSMGLPDDEVRMGARKGGGELQVTFRGSSFSL